MFKVKDLGQVAFEAYSDDVGGKTYDNKVIPVWDKLSDQVRNAWGQAAISAALYALQHYPITFDLGKEDTDYGEKD